MGWGVIPHRSDPMKHKHHFISSSPAVEATGSLTGSLFPSWVRLFTRLFAASLDPKLAAGQHPASSQMLAARAQQLVAAPYRRGIANAWLHLLTEARRRHDRFDLSVPLV